MTRGKKGKKGKKYRKKIQNNRYGQKINIGRCRKMREHGQAQGKGKAETRNNTCKETSYKVWKVETRSAKRCPRKKEKTKGLRTEKCKYKRSQPPAGTIRKKGKGGKGKRNRMLRVEKGKEEGHNGAHGDSKPGEQLGGENGERMDRAIAPSPTRTGTTEKSREGNGAQGGSNRKKANEPPPPHPKGGKHSEQKRTQPKQDEGEGDRNPSGAHPPAQGGESEWRIK